MMNSLTETDKHLFEKILGMENGYVLRFNNTTFASFFSKYDIDIDAEKYLSYGTSKANRLRAFWNQEPDTVVCPILEELLNISEVDNKSYDTRIFEKCRKVIARLSDNVKIKQQSKPQDIRSKAAFTTADIEKLPLSSDLLQNITIRLIEAQKTMQVEAYLSTIILYGSVLEGVLLGIAQRHPEKFNRSLKSPKNHDNKPKPFKDWHLTQLIEVAHDIDLLKLDVKEFAHNLRNFRNYIHPIEQVDSKFNPTQHTAQICLSVLNAALESIIETCEIWTTN